MNPKQTDETTRQKILLTALDEFMEKGIAGARMQTIADRAGCNKAMLHYYFKSKESLYDQSFQLLLKQFDEKMRSSIVLTDDLQVFLSGVIASFFNYHINNPGFIKLILREFAGGLPALKEKMKKDDKDSIPPAIKNMIQTVTQLQANGVIRDDMEPLQVIMSITGLLGSSMLQTHVYTSMTGENFQDFLTLRQDSVLKILETGLQPQSK